jgi:2-oxo-4-hydroxy-4-carboxy-5-ureidoimidazoline decarboxylase
MNIDEINTLPHAAFVDALGWIFERSPWVAERAWWRRPFKSLEALHTAMMDEVERATLEEQLELLRAHPDLGGRAGLSTASASEQAAAGLDGQAPDPQMRQLNAQYRERFGHPFLFAVKGASRSEIVQALQERLNASPEEEFREALRQVRRIAWFRIMG